MDSQEENVVKSEEPGNKKGIYLGIGVLIVIIIAILFYFFYWVKTPTYSLNIIRSSVEKHDLVKFEQHVDLKSVYNRAFDSIVMGRLNKSGYADSQLAVGIVTAMKGGLVDALVSQTQKYVETGSFEGTTNKVANDNANNNANPGKDAAKNLAQRTNAQGMEFKGVESTQKEGKIAVVTIKVLDKQLQKDFLIKLKMRELDNGEWQLVEVSNLSEFMDEHDKAVADKLAELNKPIKEKIAKIVAISGVKGKVQNENGFFPIYYLYDTVYFKLLDKTQEASRFDGVLTITSSDNKILIQDNQSVNGIEAVYSKPEYNSQNEYSSTFKRNNSLNQFIGNEKHIIDAGLNACKLSYEITKLTLKDGTVIQLLDKLPDNKK